MDEILKEIQLHIDNLGYSEKPSGNEIKSISNRITRSVSIVTPAELANMVGNLGQTVVLATMHGKRHKANIIQQQVLALDFDNAPTGKKTKLEGESYQSYKNIKEHEFIQQYGSFMYKTFSHSDEWEKFRVVFVLDTPLYSAEQVESAYKFLLLIKPQKTVHGCSLGGLLQKKSITITNCRLIFSKVRKSLMYQLIQIAHKV